MENTKFTHNIMTFKSQSEISVGKVDHRISQIINGKPAEMSSDQQPASQLMNRITLNFNKSGTNLTKHTVNELDSNQLV